MKIIEFHMRILKIMKILEFPVINIKITEITEFHAEITKIKKQILNKTYMDLQLVYIHTCSN